MTRSNFETYIEIDASPEEVWKELVDFEHWTEWSSSIQLTNEGLLLLSSASSSSSSSSSRSRRLLRHGPFRHRHHHHHHNHHDDTSEKDMDDDDNDADDVHSHTSSTFCSSPESTTTRQHHPKRLRLKVQLTRTITSSQEVIIVRSEAPYLLQWENLPKHYYGGGSHVRHTIRLTPFDHGRGTKLEQFEEPVHNTHNSIMGGSSRQQQQPANDYCASSWKHHPTMIVGPPPVLLPKRRKAFENMNQALKDRVEESKYGFL